MNNKRWLVFHIHTVVKENLVFVLGPSGVSLMWRTVMFLMFYLLCKLACFLVIVSSILPGTETSDRETEDLITTAASGMYITFALVPPGHWRDRDYSTHRTALQVRNPELDRIPNLGTMGLSLLSPLSLSLAQRTILSWLHRVVKKVCPLLWGMLSESSSSFSL